MAFSRSLMAGLFLLLALAPGSGEGPIPEHRIDPPRYRAGDDLAWATSAGDESEWTTEPPRSAGNWWMRTSVLLAEPATAGSDLALRVFLPASAEAFWDGELVARNGRVGADATSESPGRFVFWVSLGSDRLTAGRHLLAVRASSHHAFRNRGLFGVALLDRAAAGRRESRRTALFLACVGVLLASAAVFGLLYRATGRRRDTVLFALLCLAVGTMVLLEYVRYVHPYAYPWHFWRLTSISGLAIVVGLLLPAFFLHRLGLDGRRWLPPALALAYIGLMVVVDDPDQHAVWVLRTAAAVAFALAAWAVWKRRPGGRVALVGSVPVLVPTFFTGLRYADHWFFAGFLVLVLVLLVELGVDLARGYRQRQEAMVTSERLRNEMLRKTIQPHFLMNSLAAAVGHIEEEPARGIAVLRDLARELQGFFALGERATVSLAEELELCRRHVATMRHLLDCPLELCVDGGGAVLGQFEIPPGVVLTLVENALTHGDWTGGGKIDLRIRDDGDAIGIEIANPVRRDVEPLAGRPGREGTGLAYVRRQLERAGPGGGLGYRVEAGRWVSRLELSRPRSSP